MERRRQVDDLEARVRAFGGLARSSGLVGGDSCTPQNPAIREDYGMVSSCSADYTFLALLPFFFSIVALWLAWLPHHLHRTRPEFAFQKLPALCSSKTPTVSGMLSSTHTTSVAWILQSPLRVTRQSRADLLITDTEFCTRPLWKT